VLLLFQIALAAALFVWAGASRFGAALPAPPGIAPGKDFLILSTAELLRFHGDVGPALEHYFEHRLARAAGRLHAPADLSDAKLVEWLDRLGERRGLHDRLARIEEEVGALSKALAREAPRAIAAAVRVHDWTKEIVHGAIRDRARG
jgi:hypothetical protein